jgi:iron complex transport system ATP-binding protein
MLSAKNISYKAGATTLLDNLSVNFELGKLNLIIGPNGAGKSTFIKILCNQLTPSTGTVEYGNRNLRSFSAMELARIRSVLSQQIEIAFPMQVHEVVMMGRYCHFTGKPGNRDVAACEEAMRFFDVYDFAERNYMSLSGGEKQRVHFARVLSQIWYPVEDGCRYLLLDEPLTFLDVRYQFDFMKKILQFMWENEVVTVGVVHDLNLAARFANKILLLNRGKLMAYGNRKEVLTAKNIREAYGLEPVFHQEGEQLYISF